MFFLHILDQNLSGVLGCFFNLPIHCSHPHHHPAAPPLQCSSQQHFLHYEKASYSTSSRANVFFPFILFVKISNSKECVQQQQNQVVVWLVGWPVKNVQMVWRVTCGLTPIIKDDCFDLDNLFFFFENYKNLHQCEYKQDVILGVQLLGPNIMKITNVNVILSNPINSQDLYKI